MPDPEPTRRNEILDAALERFTAYGFSRTSMADIADGAGISRQGLYLHFDNKEAIYRAVLERTLDRASTAALAALDDEPALGEQLDAFLQRSWGDLSTWTLATRHGADMIQAKAGYAADVSEANTRRVRRSLAAHLRRVAPGATKTDVAGWVDLLTMAPLGFRYDQPAIALYRRRLSQLAEATAASIERAR